MMHSYFTSSWHRLRLAALLALASVPAAQAQLAYKAVNTITAAGTYTDLGATGNPIDVTSTDDANSAAKAIGFTFNYNGTSFTQFVLNTNGFLRLGSAAPSAAALFLTTNDNTYPGGPFASTNAADVNLIAPFNADLQAGTAAAEYRVATTGTAGSRICTIQWKNVRDKLTPPAVQFDNINFQVKLYEGSNNIEFVYGTWAASAAATTAFKSALCGLKGNNSGASNFVTAFKLSSAAFSAVAFQDDNYVSNGGIHFNYQRAAPPDAGRTFRFLIPTCARPTGLAVSAITQTTAVASFNGPANGTGYSLVYGPTGFDPATGGTTVAAPSSPYTLTGLAPGTGYDLYVRANCGSIDQSLLSSVVSFRTPCTATVVSTFPYVEGFDNVAAGSLPCGVVVTDVNADGSTWAVKADPTGTPPNAMVYEYNDTNAANDWFFTPGLALKAGFTYQLQFQYSAYDAAYPEGLEVKYGTTATPAGQTRLLYSNTNITNESYLTTTASQVPAITLTADGTYYIGFHAISKADQFALFVDDVRVTATRVLAVRGNTNTLFSAEAAPVPFGDNLTLTLNTLRPGPLHLTLRDVLGCTLRQSASTAPRGTSTLAVPEVGSLPAGVYFLTVEQAGQMQLLRVTHQ